MRRYNAAPRASGTDISLPGAPGAAVTPPQQVVFHYKYYQQKMEKTEMQGLADTARHVIDMEFEISSVELIGQP